MKKIITFEIEVPDNDQMDSFDFEYWTDDPAREEGMTLITKPVPGSLSITAAPRIDHYSGRPYEVYPFEHDHYPVSFAPVDYDDLSKGWRLNWYSGDGLPDEARKVAAALNVAAGLCERMKDNEDKHQ